MSSTTGGVFVEPLATGTGGDSRVKQYLLTDASNGDYFICRTLSVSLNVEDPEDPIVENTIGASDVYIAKPFHLRRSVFDGKTITVGVKQYSHEYNSATTRLVTDVDLETTQNQKIIPHLIPAALVVGEGGVITTATVAPTIIYAVKCSGLGVTYLDGDNNVSITLLAQSDGWAWSAA